MFALIYFTGKVQGVGFRNYTKFKAKRNEGIAGYARNLDDGRVEVLLHGTKLDLRKMIGHIIIGPPKSRVTSAHVTFFRDLSSTYPLVRQLVENYQTLSTFVIIRDAGTIPARQNRRNDRTKVSVSR